MYDRMKMDMELKNLSDSTINCYLAHMRNFVEYFGRSPETMADEEVREYLHYLKTTKSSCQSTINQAYSAIKRFFTITLQREWNFTKIPRGKVPKKLPVVLSPGEVSQILDATYNIKHLAIFTTIYSAGLRVSEATNLKISDIDSARMTILIRSGKGAKDRYTILGERTLELLRRYFSDYKPVDWLFTGACPDKPISNSTVQKSFKMAIKNAGITKKATVHTLRHSFATHLIESGTDLYFIQKLMGHTAASTTAIYLHVTGKNVAKVSSPIDKLEVSNKPIDTEEIKKKKDK